MDHCNAVVSWLTNIDWSQVQWNQLWSFSDFHWVYGKTPFSQLQVPATVTFFYLITIFMLQKWMKDREAWSLKTFSLFHNLFLTLLSCAMVGGVLYGAFEKAGLLGPWSGLMCHQEADPMYGTLYYWSYIYYLSKIYEPTGSYPLVLKKKPLIFLHVYHHFVMPYVGWAGLQGRWAMALWTSCLTNGSVHILMYYYYLVSSMGYSPWWKKYLTMMQIVQFMIGTALSYVYFYYYFVDFTVDGTLSPSFKQGCTGDTWAVLSMFSVNTSFLLLFVRWYFENYRSSAVMSKRRGVAGPTSRSE